jgi:hypothetical protein
VDCAAEKKGQPLGRPVYEGNEAFEYDVYLDFPYRSKPTAAISAHKQILRQLALCGHRENAVDALGRICTVAMAVSLEIAGQTYWVGRLVKVREYVKL